MLRGVLGGFARGRRQTSAATLYLDFLAGLNDSRITYSGGTNGTRVNSAGVIVAATTPRFDYDPVTLAAKGLLVEEARTNLAIRSQQLDIAWSPFQTTVTADATTSPDGTVNADKLAETATTTPHALTELATVAASTTYTFSAFVHSAENTLAQISFDDGSSNGCFANINLSTGAITRATLAGTGTYIGSGVVAYGDGWYRVYVTGGIGSATVGRVGLNLINSTLAGIFPGYTGTAGNGVYFWGAQLEAGAFPTSYIPTTSASVTRTADSAVMTGTNFSSWYNATQGTLVCGYDVNYDSAESIFPGAITINDGTTNNRIVIYSRTVDDTNRGLVGSGGAVVADLTVTNIVYGTPQKAAISYAANDFAYCANAGIVQTDASGAVPTVSQIDIGVLVSGTNWLNGHIRTLQYFPRRLPNTQLQTLTA